MEHSLASLLNQPLDDTNVKRPQPLPDGTYFGVITSFKFGESRNKKTPNIRLDINVTSAGDDVRPTVEAQGIDVTTKRLNRDFYFTPDALYRWTDFLTSCNIKWQGRAINDQATDLPNTPVMFTTKTRTADDGRVFNDIADITGKMAA